MNWWLALCSRDEINRELVYSEAFYHLLFRQTLSFTWTLDNAEILWFLWKTCFAFHIWSACWNSPFVTNPLDLKIKWYFLRFLFLNFCFTYILIGIDFCAVVRYWSGGLDVRKMVRGLGLLGRIFVLLYRMF